MVVPRRWMLVVAILVLPGSAVRSADSPAAWKPSQTVALNGLKVTFSHPVLVARSKGYLWFPTVR